MSHAAGPGRTTDPPPGILRRSEPPARTTAVQLQRKRSSSTARSILFTLTAPWPSVQCRRFGNGGSGRVPPKTHQASGHRGRVSTAAELEATAVEAVRRAEDVMRLYRKIIPKIAREIVRTLHSKSEVEVEDGRMDEAELDLAAVMVEYMNEEEKLVNETKETMARRGFSQDRFAQVKKSLAEARGFKQGDDGVDYVLSQMLEALFNSKNIAEVYADDKTLRLFFKQVFEKYTGVDEELDREARSRLKNLREGTSEWEIEYPRVVAALKRQKGLV
ncbi:MAG: DUF507 family protein [Deltaproteobacteria bacterium]|nr:DUF507 family protein [Deltaproteobacteria bacterium]